LVTATLAIQSITGEIMDYDQNKDAQSMNNASNVGLPPSGDSGMLIAQPNINPASQSTKTNTMAIMSLVFSFIFNLLGLVFGIIALGQIKKTGESGRGLAIAGIIISAIGIIFGAIAAGLIILGIVSSDGKVIDKSDKDPIANNNNDGSSSLAKSVEIDTFAQAGDLRVKANSVSEYEGKEFMKPVAGSIFLNVELEIENKGFDTKYISPTSQTYIKDSQNRKYKTDIMSVPDAAATISGELPNNESVKGLVGFELPKDAKGLMLYFEDGSLTDVDMAVIDLGR
jgi:hypothetical protein